MKAIKVLDDGLQHAKGEQQIHLAYLKGEQIKTPFAGLMDLLWAVNRIFFLLQEKLYYPNTRHRAKSSHSLCRNLNITQSLVLRH